MRRMKRLRGIAFALSRSEKISKKDSDYFIRNNSIYIINVPKTGE